jgi:hypothetical protein
MATDFCRAIKWFSIFSMAQLIVGEGKVPVFIVLYIDGSYLKKEILIRPVYHK